MRVDSDEEAAAASTVVSKRSLHNTMEGDFANNLLLENVAIQLRDLRRDLLNFNANVPEIVTFCVGGKLFSVRREVLLKDPQSVLFLMTTEHFSRGVDELQRDDAIEIPCRDPTLFGMLLNLLRGYRRPIPREYVAACSAEASFYGLNESWRSRYAAPAEALFRPLVRDDRLFSDVVCAAASPFYSSGLHTITFGVVRCEIAAVGVVAEGASVDRVEKICGCDGLALYWNDGRVAHNFGGLVIEKTGCLFTSNAVITIELDCDDNILQWSLLGEQPLAVVRLPPKKSYAFAAVLLKSSELQILRCDLES